MSSRRIIEDAIHRIEQAKHDWREERFGQVPDETEFIPLPEESNRKEGQPL
jgi:hypothetical protein